MQKAARATQYSAQMTMPPLAWQIIFAVIGAIAISIMAFMRITGMASPGAEPDSRHGDKVSAQAAS